MAPGTIVAQVSGAPNPAPPPPLVVGANHAVLGFAPVALEGQPFNHISHMIVKGGAFERPIAIDDCRWAKAGEAVTLLITTDREFSYDDIICSVRTSVIRMGADPNLVLPTITRLGPNRSLFAAAALVANVLLEDAEIQVFPTDAQADYVGKGELRLMQNDGSPYPDSAARVARQAVYVERKGRTSVIYVQYPRPYLTFDEPRRLEVTGVVTAFVTRYFIEHPASVGRQPAEEVAGVPLFTALGYPEPQIRFHIRRPASFETPVAFFSTFDLEKLKFFDVGCYGDACKTRMPRHLSAALNVAPCCFRAVCDKNHYGQCTAHKNFLGTARKVSHLKRHLIEPGDAAKEVERRLEARAGPSGVGVGLDFEKFD